MNNFGLVSWIFPIIGYIPYFIIICFLRNAFIKNKHIPYQLIIANMVAGIVSSVISCVIHIPSYIYFEDIFICMDLLKALVCVSMIFPYVSIYKSIKDQKWINKSFNAAMIILVIEIIICLCLVLALCYYEAFIIRNIRLIVYIVVYCVLLFLIIDTRKAINK